MQRRRLPALILTMLFLIAVLNPVAAPTAAGLSLGAPAGGSGSALVISAWQRLYQGWHGAGLATVTTRSGSFRHFSELHYRTPDGRNCWGTWCGAGEREEPQPWEYFDEPATYSYPVLCVTPEAGVKGYYRILFSGWTETKVESHVDFSSKPYQVVQTTKTVEHPPAELVLPVGLPGLGDPKLARTDVSMTPGSDLLVSWAPSTPGLGSLPDSCWVMTEAAKNRTILYQVAPLAAQPRAQLLTDADAWKPGVSQTIYVRVDHDAAAPLCPVSVTLDLPAWLQVEDAQGAQIAAGELPAYQFISPAQEGETVPVRTLSWKATFKPGRPFERWVTVTPSDIPEGARALGALLRPVETDNGNEIFTSQLQWLWKNVGATTSLSARRQPVGEGSSALTFTAELDGLLEGVLFLRLNGGGEERMILWPTGATSLTVLVQELGAPPVLDWYRYSAIVSQGTTQLEAELVQLVGGERRAGPKMTVPLTGDATGPWSAAGTESTTSASAAAIPAKRQPAGAVGGAGCATSDQPRVVIKAEPPVLREKEDFTSRITATVVDLPGLPAASGAPVTLAVTAPGLLSKVVSFGATTTATLTSDSRSPVDLTVTAETADGDTAYLVVPLGRYFLQGQVLLRPGDGSEQPVDRALVGAWEAGSATPYQTYTDALGQYRTAVRSTEPLTITAEAGGYVKGQLPGKTPGPNNEDTIEAPPLYLISDDTLLLARRRLDAIYGLHNTLGPADNLAGWAGLFPPPDTPDPTAPGAGIPAWLDRVEQSMSHPPHQEEALRRLNLALELEQIAARNAKWAADDIAATLWDDGLGLLTDLWAAANGTFEITRKMGDYYGGLRGKSDPVTQSLDRAKVNLLEQKSSLHDRIYDVVRRLVGNLSRAPAGLSSAEKAQWVDEKTNSLVSLITGKAWEQRQAALALWQPDPTVQQETLKAVTSPLPQGVSLDIKEVLADWIAREYLAMVSTELTDALKMAAADPAGFREGGYEVARLNVRDKLEFVEWTREKVSTTPVEAAFRQFFDGAVADYQNWGQLAIAAVTAGAAVPAMKQIDVGLGLVQTFFKGVRVAKAMNAYFETLAPESDWSRAVRDGIRTAFTSYAE
ncbi:MAG TPA: hypothetical protein VD969_29690 [Symbiobacteriaceae bacterium]|nr:hypothetical protein [Symbiobacteriaceae bacterium]